MVMGDFYKKGITMTNDEIASFSRKAGRYIKGYLTSMYREGRETDPEVVGTALEQFLITYHPLLDKVTVGTKCKWCDEMSVEGQLCKRCEKQWRRALRKTYGR